MTHAPTLTVLTGPAGTSPLEVPDLIHEQSPTPTERWLACAGLLPLEGPAGTAERLLLLTHYGADWDGWIARYRDRYWSHLLPDRVWCATFQAPTLRRWWRDVAQDIGSSPRNRAERDELEQLLREPARPVLQVLREETEALLLRTRIVADAVRAARAQQSQGAAGEHDVNQAVGA